MLIGEDEHEMAAFTPDRERATASRGKWNPPAAGRGFLSSAWAKERPRDSSALPSLWHPQRAQHLLIKEGGVRRTFGPSSRSPRASPLAFARVSSQLGGSPKPGPRVAQPEPRPASGMFQLCRGGTAGFSSTDPGLCSLATGDRTRDQGRQQDVAPGPGSHTQSWLECILPFAIASKRHRQRWPLSSGSEAKSTGGCAVMERVGLPLWPRSKPACRGK